MRGTRWLAVAILAGVPALALAADGTAPYRDYTGAELYARFCASCHGARALGDGTVAPALKVIVPDLTRIAARNGGKFPADRVREIVDGRAVLPAHGARFMPVWGYEFEAQAEGDAPGRAAAQALIDRLVEHLRTLQQ
jgi:mono/diheme cytochrome c family protein